jgi:hypothetical protein
MFAPVLPGAGVSECSALLGAAELENTSVLGKRSGKHLSDKHLTENYAALRKNFIVST